MDVVAWPPMTMLIRQAGCIAVARRQPYEYTYVCYAVAVQKNKQ